MRNKLFILIFLLLAGAAGYSQKATPVIFDSDMGPDYDDVGAITLLHAFADSGKVRILATMASDNYEGVAGVLNLFNTYFHRPEIPVGVPKGAAVDQKDWQHWTDTILAKYPHSIWRNEEAADAVMLYRKILAGQPDGSVVIVTVGFLTNLAGLLRTGPDKYSSLDGLELVRKKVKRLVSMAGRFPSGREFNIWKDAAAGQFVFTNWPGPVLFSGFEIGVKIKTGLAIVADETIANSPVKDVFRICLPMAKEDSLGRSSWDETAVLVGCAGYAGYFDIGRGRIKIAADGSNGWEDAENGTQTHLVAMRPESEIADVINRLIKHQPKKGKE